MINTELFKNYKRVALAVSGGRDSMALLHDMAEHFPSDYFYVINIEHGIRGEESRKDSAFVGEYAMRLGLDVKRYDVDAVAYSKQYGFTLEQGARQLRRDIFRDEIKAGRCERVVVAHHMDDNVESILMHIFRGASIRGLKGMQEDDGMLLRPLLGVSRAEIDEYIKEHDIPYREDSTNSDTAYSRNFLRHEIMPLLRERYNGIDSNIVRLSKSASEDEEYLSREANNYVMEDGDKVLVGINAPDVIFKRAVYKAFTMLGVTADVEERHYSLLMDLRSAQSGTTLDMPYGVKARVEYGRIAFMKEHVHVKMGEKLDGNVGAMIFCQGALGTHNMGDYTLEVTEYNGDIKPYTDENGYRVLFVDGDKLMKMVLRKRRVGDTFKKFGGGTKKLKDYFIDMKVPQDRRDVPLICDDEKVLVVAGYEISEEVSVTKDTKAIYKIQLRRNA